MAVTVNGFTWNVDSGDIGMFCTTNSSNNIGLRNTLLFSGGNQLYGSSHIFFDLSYVPQNNGKLKISVNNITATNDLRTHYSWREVTGTITANGVTIFSGTLSSADGSTKHSAGSLCTLTGGNVRSGVINYTPDSQGNIAISFVCNFGIVHRIDKVFPAGAYDDWTNSGGKASNAASVTYSHTHNLTTTTTSHPTCTTTGLTHTTCSSCDYNYTTTLPVLGHTWDEGVITKNPTYETTGIRTHTCSVCSTTKEEVEGKLPPTIYIDNGDGFDGYGAYIDNGSDWEAYAVYIDDGEKFVAYC